MLLYEPEQMRSAQPGLFQDLGKPQSPDGLAGRFGLRGLHDGPLLSEVPRYPVASNEVNELPIYAGVLSTAAATRSKIRASLCPNSSRILLFTNARSV